jgi:hypothetical protein
MRLAIDKQAPLGGKFCVCMCGVSAAHHTLVLQQLLLLFEGACGLLGWAARIVG